MKALPTENNFLGITEPELHAYETSKVVIQSVPYEHTSSYLAGSDKFPEKMMEASHYVEFYDEELDQETYKTVGGIATLPALNFENCFDADAIARIENATDALINDGKFVISVGAEHTVTYGFVKAFVKKYPNMSVLQIDAHSDLRNAYHDNIYSHAAVMHRVHDLGVNLCQAGIRAQCKEESDLIKNNPALIHTFYAHYIRANAQTWMDELISQLTDDVYITIDADGFDPSIMPAVGTAEPNGLFWHETTELLKKVAQQKNVIGFDIVECAPRENDILSEFTCAKLLYRLLGYVFKFKKS